MRAGETELQMMVRHVAAQAERRSFPSVAPAPTVRNKPNRNRIFL